MGESTGGAAAQRQPDHRPADAAEPHLVAAVGSVLAASDQIIQHRKQSPGRIRLSVTARSRQNVAQAWFMLRMREGLWRARFPGANSGCVRRFRGPPSVGALTVVFGA